MANRLRLALGALFFLVMFIHWGAVAYGPFLGSYDGWSSRWTDGRPIIISVDGKGPASQLQVGDVILALNGVNPQRQPSILNLNRSVPAGTAYSMTISRNQQKLEISLQTVPRVVNLFQVALMPLINLLFLFTALIVFALKPADKQAWLLALMLGSYTAILGGTVDGFPQEIVEIVRFAKLIGLCFIPILVHFFLYFPDRSPVLKRFPRTLLIVYGLFSLFVLPTFGPERLPTVIAAWMRSTWLLHQRWFGLLGMVFTVGLLFFGLVVLAINYRAATPADRRRLRVVVAGSGAGFFNLFLMPLGEFSGLNSVFPLVWQCLDLMLLFTLPLIPLSFAYAIIRHQVIPVSLIIRRGVRYLLVSRGSTLLEVIAVTLVVTALLTYVFSRIKPSGLVVGIVSAAVGIATWKFTSRLHDKYLAPIIDRKFFRESYDSHQIIADLTETLRSTTSLPQLCELVATQIQSALQTENVVVLLLEESTGDYSSDYSCEFSSSDGKASVCQKPFRLHGSSQVIPALKESGQPLEVNWSDDADLQPMKSALLLPLVTRQGMPGIISLGARLGDLPFSREDKVLLMSVAGPTTFAIENSRLVERMIEEARRREEIEAENEQRAKELEEARQLQLSMLPKNLPELPGVEIAAYMKTATEVGGDYYDFHLAVDGTLTVAVGDATGHGLKAGTVVTAMKSLFHCFADESELLPVMNRSSRVLKKMNLRSLFMGLTVIRLAGPQLKISSAGMPPMLIYRAKDQAVEEVLIKTMPLGSISGYVYHQQELAVGRGDVVVMMSDGLPERFNPEGEMFDYWRASNALADSAHASPREIIDHFVSAGDAWASGRPQDDDVTFVVLKVK